MEASNLFADGIRRGLFGSHGGIYFDRALTFSIGSNDAPEMNHDYSKRDYLLPEGCKDLGDVLKLEAQKTNEEIRQPLRTNEEIRQVFRRYVPEIAAGTVEIVSLARDVGRRCLLVVRSHDPKVSAVEACSFQ